MKDNIEKVLKKIRRVDEKKRWIIGGDFNVRTGEQGGLEDGEMEIKQRLLGKMINKQGNELLK